MKKLVFFFIGVLLAFIFSTIATINVSGNLSIIIQAISLIFAGLIGIAIASRTTKHTDNVEPKYVKALIRILPIALIVVAVIVYVLFTKLNILS